MEKLIYFLLLLLLCGCSASNPESPDEDLLPRKISVYGWAGEVFHLPIDMDYTDCVLKSDNPEIADAVFMDGKEFCCIKTFKAGSTCVYLSDKNGTVLVEYYIWSDYFSSKEIEEITMHPTLKSNVIVEAEDLTVKNLLEEELWEEVKHRKGTIYSFNADDRSFTMRKEATGVDYAGTYECNIDSLSLSYDNKIEKYAFHIAPERRNYVLQMDKTMDYQILYPNAGITNVKVDFIWYDWYAVKPKS